MSAPPQPQAAIAIRKVDSFKEMDACVNLQQTVWQFRDLDAIPRRMFVVSRAVGGQIFGAWDGDHLAGFALAVPGVRDGHPYLHSHMLAVSPEYRNRGIGMRLKLAQREDALTRGIDLMEWTFDPLQTRNAYLNIEKLGAVVRRYTPDFYGLSTSPVHGSLPTDRLHAEWWLKSRRVEALVSGSALPEYTIKETVTVTEASSTIRAAAHQPVSSGLELLLHVRRQFLDAFSSGLMVLRFQSSGGGASRYMLGMPDQLV